MIMKLQFAALLVALSVFALSAMGCKDKEQSELNTDTNVEVNISDPEIQAVFTRLNAFRLSDEANYLDKDNSTVISLVGQLKALELDADLCKAAQVRSNELLKKWSHTRPDGRDAVTVLADLGIAYTAWGENIAAGNKSGEKTFVQWKEDNKNYSGQGHRRNMLGKQFTRVGLAYSYDANSEYKYYWTMILAR